MKGFLLGLLCGLVIAVMAAVIFAFSLVRLAERKPEVADNSALIVRLEGDIPEKPPIQIPLAAFESQATPTVRDLWAMLHRAAGDSRIKAVVLVPRNLDAGWAKLEQIRESVLSFRKSGKPVYAFLRFPGSREYYLASAADRIYASPGDYVNVKGLRIESVYVKGLLDKFGINAHVEHTGKYKDAGDVLTRTSMSPETREVLNQVLDQFYGNLTTTIASGRNKTPEQVRALIDQGPFSGEQALETGLVDALGYEDRVFRDLGGRVGRQNLQRLAFRDYLRASGSTQGRNKIALVVGDGVILQAAGGDSLLGQEAITSGGFARLLRRVKSDNTIRGVIVRINSPGGDAIASDDILHEMVDLARRKPTVVSMSDYAASGGYYIAVSGAPIVAYPNTLTGSIGVISAKLNFRGLYDKLGISKEILSRGENATIDSDYTAMDPAKQAKFREMVNAAYHTFLTRVAEGRHRTVQQIEPLAQGRVWLGAQAKQNGLIDELGGLDKAVELIRQKARIPASESVALIPYPPPRNLLDVLFSPSEQSPGLMPEARLLHQLFGHDRLRIAPVLRGGLLALMPYSVEIN